jgi:hypothetical protein
MASIRCRKGETFPNTHIHTSVHEVKVCQGIVPAPRSGQMVEVPGLGISVPVNDRRVPFTNQPAELGTFRPKGLNLTIGGPRVDPELEATVPAGRYAIRVESGVRFYHVDKPADGRWAGRTFVSRQASDDLFPIRSSKERAEILQKIAMDPMAAMLRYGREIGICGLCGRTLTNDESRKRGIGPVCLAKL